MLPPPPAGFIPDTTCRHQRLRKQKKIRADDELLGKKQFFTVRIWRRSTGRCCRTSGQLRRRRLYETRQEDAEKTPHTLTETKKRGRGRDYSDQTPVKVCEEAENTSTTSSSGRNLILWSLHNIFRLFVLAADQETTLTGGGGSV